MSIDNIKLTKNAAWLAAGAAAVIAIVVTLALNPVKPGSWRIIFGVMGAGATVLAAASTMLTPAGVGGVVGRFAAAGAVVGGFYLWYAHHLMNKATAAIESAGGSVTGDTGGLASLIGTFGGVIAAIAIVLSSLVGAVIGTQLRNRKGVASLIPGRKAA